MRFPFYYCDGQKSCTFFLEFFRGPALGKGGGQFEYYPGSGNFHKIDQVQNWPLSPREATQKKFEKKCARLLPVTVLLIKQPGGIGGIKIMFGPYQLAEYEKIPYYNNPLPLFL